METSGKLFWSLAIIILIIQPLSAQDSKISSNYSVVQANSSSQNLTNLTFNETSPNAIQTILVSTSKSISSSLAGANSSLQNTVSLPAASSNSVGTSSNEKSPVTFITDPVTKHEYVSDQVIVRYNTRKFQDPAILKAHIRDSNAKIGAQVNQDFSDSGLPGMQVVKLTSNVSVKDAIREYQKNPDVVYAQPNYVYHTTALTPNDPSFDLQWGLKNTGRPGADINATAAWEISTGSNSVVVAVVDTGILYTHSDLSANIWTNPGESPGNGIDDDNNGYIDDVRGWNFITSTSDPSNPIDDNGHGTHVSGTIGAVGNNSLGVVGVNWHVKMMALKAFDDHGNGLTSDAVSAILYANANGASVIVNAWNGDVIDPGLKEVIDLSPAVVVCAAGNSPVNINNDVTPQYPSSFNSSNIISVAATNQTDSLTSFSHYGLNSVDLAAPGENILSTYFNDRYVYSSGTSMATSHVAGVAALVKSVNPKLTNIQIKDIILNNVDVIPSLSGKVNTSGRLNAYKAVLAAQSISTPPIADFTGSPTTGVAPLTILFTDQSANTPTMWNWSFGDGNNTDSQLKNPTHTYFTEGNFTVSLNATNSWGSNISTKVKYINVTALPPVANFTVMRTTGKAPVTIRFVDLSTNVPSSWNWTFGDGSSNSYQQNPYHTYLTPGIYSVTLNVTNSAGASGMMKPEFINVTNMSDKIGVSNGLTWAIDTTGTNNFIPSRDLKNFGVAGFTPVIGDWNGDGQSEIGVSNGLDWYLDMNGSGIFDPVADHKYWGALGFTPVVGDWNGDGRDEIGVSDGLTWAIDTTGTSVYVPSRDLKSWGALGFTPVVGDWNGDGRDKIGVSDGLTWAIDTTGTSVYVPSRDRKYWGALGFTPVVGDWNGDGRDKIGVSDGLTWAIDTNGTTIFVPSRDLKSWGALGYTPIVGKWR